MDKFDSPYNIDRSEFLGFLVSGEFKISPENHRIKLYNRVTSKQYTPVSNIYRREKIAVQNEANSNISYHTFATRATKIY